MNSEDETELVGELEKLLKRQIELARRGSISGLEPLAGKSEGLVAKITAAGLLEKPEHKAGKERLVKLYRDLQLLLSTQKADVAGQLKSIDKGKRTLSVYRGNV
jgi:hypothetical protein